MLFLEFHKVPKYLYVFTMRYPLIFSSSVSLGLLLVILIIPDFNLFIFIDICSNISYTALIIFYSYLLLSVTIAISSAYTAILAPEYYSALSESIIKILNSAGDRIIPCMTPLWVCIFSSPILMEQYLCMYFIILSYFYSTTWCLSIASYSYYRLA